MHVSRDAFLINKKQNVYLRAFSHKGTLPGGVYSTIKGGTHHLGENVEPGWAILIEMMLTTLLVFTVIMSAVNPKTKTSLAPLAIGFAVAVDIMAG